RGRARAAAPAAGRAAVGTGGRGARAGPSVAGGRAGGGARIAPRADPRVAMAFAVLGARLAEPIVFDDLTSVPTSYPAFFETLAALGAELVPDAGRPAEEKS